jgi:hypothetical protein
VAAGSMTACWSAAQPARSRYCKATQLLLHTLATVRRCLCGAQLQRRRGPVAAAGLAPPPALPCLGLPSPSAHTWLVSLLLASHSPAFALAPFIHSLDTPTSNARPVCLLNLHLILVLHPTCSLREDDTVEARFITVDHNGRNVSEADRIDKSHARTTRCLSA